MKFIYGKLVSEKRLRSARKVRLLNFYIIWNYEVIHGVISIRVIVAVVTRLYVDAGLCLDERVCAAPRSPSFGSLDSLRLRVVLDIGVHATAAPHWSNFIVV